MPEQLPNSKPCQRITNARPISVQHLIYRRRRSEGYPICSVEDTIPIILLGYQIARIFSTEILANAAHPLTTINVAVIHGAVMKNALKIVISTHMYPAVRNTSFGLLEKSMTAPRIVGLVYCSWCYHRVVVAIPCYTILLLLLRSSSLSVPSHSSLPTSLL